MMSKFWKSLVSSDGTSSSKRLVTLIISLHFIIASFAILFIAFYVIFYLPKGKVEPELLALLKEVLEYDFYIILSGLGFITTENMGQVMLERAKAKIAGDVKMNSSDNADDCAPDDKDKKKDTKKPPKPPEPPKEDEMIS